MGLDYCNAFERNSVVIKTRYLYKEDNLRKLLIQKNSLDPDQPKKNPDTDLDPTLIRIEEKNIFTLYAGRHKIRSLKP